MKSFYKWIIAANVICAGFAHSQALLPSDINATISGTTTFDNNSGLYTYNYSITNYGGSPKVADEFHIPLRGASILNITAPAGWEGTVNRAGTMMGWCACKEEGFVPPPGFIDDGRGIPSKFSVAPGATLSGFAFQSPYPPSPGTYYIGGWVPVPVEGIDFPVGQEPVIPDFPLNMKTGVLTGPLKSDSIYLGGRRPAVDGFLVFANLKSGEAYPRPVIVDIIFSQNGETVTQSTFRATLNGSDVTSKFNVIDFNRRRAVFDVGVGSPLIIGKNILSTSVQGTVPGSNKKATDVDKATFVVK